MYKLFCDKCGKEIKPDSYIVEIETEVMIYRGGCDLFHDNSCNSSRKKICADCAKYLEELLNIKTVSKNSFKNSMNWKNNKNMI